MKIIHVQRGGWQTTFASAPPGAVFHLLVHGCKYSPELRDNPPRVRVVEHGRTHTECELIDEWPGAPEYWPPESAPPPQPQHPPSADQGRNA